MFETSSEMKQIDDDFGYENKPKLKETEEIDR